VKKVKLFKCKLSKNKKFTDFGIKIKKNCKNPLTYASLWVIILNGTSDFTLGVPYKKQKRKMRKNVL
jgi:hypothetical protein